MFFTHVLRVVITVPFIWISSATAYPVVPDPDLTQGDLCTPNDPDFSHYRYKQQIPYCERNVDYERRTKIYQAYKIGDSCRKRFTIDHFIPLSIGGNNSDENLWPEHKNVKATRPHLEEEVFEAVKSGRMTQDEAVRIITEEKTKARVKLLELMGKGGCDRPESTEDLVVE